MNELIKKLAEALDDLPYPVAYHHFNKSPVGVPFVVYYSEGTDYDHADDINYFAKEQIVIEIYSNTIDENFKAVDEVEKILSKFDDVPIWRKTTVWIDDEKLYETILELEGF